ncbi:MAG: DNA repair exonuclease [Acidimicrobiaceae bacterium]|nr:DNA repair exonuclease [Acidimicrobiaceae bacterium]
MKILHAADLHIDSPLRGLAKYEGAPIEEVRGATRRAVENLVDAAVSNAVDLVIVAGDVFDGDWKDYSTGMFWVKQLARLHDEGIPVVIVSGNHDAASEITKRLTLPPNVTQLASGSPRVKRLDHLDLAVTGQSYTNRAVVDDLAAKFPQADRGLFNIGLLHTSLDGRPGHASYAPTTVDTLRGRGYQYWALGHVHQREVVSEDPWIVFPGNLQGRHIREAGPKGASLVTVEEKEVSSVEHLELDVVRWANCTVDVSDLPTTEGILARISQELQSAVAEGNGRLVAARMNIVGRSPINSELWKDPKELEMEVRALGVSQMDLWIEKVRLDTRHVAEVDGGLVDSIGQRAKRLRDDPDQLAVVESLFTDLRNKLPAEINSIEASGDDDPPPASAEHIKATLDSAVDLISSLLNESQVQ